MVDQTRLELANDFLAAVKAEDDAYADELLALISADRESQLFAEIGKLTREFHDALSSIEGDSCLATTTHHEIPEAKEGLDFVIQQTKAAADQTLDAIEVLTPLVNSIKKEAMTMKEQWHDVSIEQLSNEQFEEKKQQLMTFLEQVNDDSEKIKADMNSIVLAQGFQDITGQVINNVIKVVHDVETSLVNLLRATGVQAVERKVVDNITAEGPQINATKKKNVVNDQNDVDSLLSSLGF